MSRQFVKVSRESDIPEGETRVFEAAGTRVLICRVDDTLHALEDVCTHDDGPLEEGELEGHEIECPRHGARFDVRTGAVCRMPAAAPVAVFPLKVVDGEVWVEVEVD